MQLLKNTICLRHYTSVRDGLSNTLMIAEKYVPDNNYAVETDYGADDACAWAGADWDIARWVQLDYATSPDPYTIIPPQPDGGGAVSDYQFGGPHLGIIQVALCDGAVRSIVYDVDPEVWRRIGLSDDGSVLDASKLGW